MSDSPERAMITAEIGGGRFSYRVGGVLLDSGRVLLHRATGDPKWVLPGGRCEFMEESGECIHREMREELGVEVQIDRLLWIVENFFHAGGMPNHEIGLYYLVELAEDATAAGVPQRGWEGDVELEFRWFDLAELASLPLVPPFLAERLSRLGTEIERVVDRRNLG